MQSLHAVLLLAVVVLEQGLRSQPAMAMEAATSEDAKNGNFQSPFSIGSAALPANIDDEDGVDFNPEDYSEMAAALGQSDETDSQLQLGQGAAGGAVGSSASAGSLVARSMAVNAAIKVLDTQLYVVRGLAVAAIRAGQAMVTARNKVMDARTLLAARLLASRLRAMRSVSNAGLRAGAALAGGALDAAQAKLRALDSVVRIGLAMSRSLAGAGMDTADAGRDLMAASLNARLQAIRTVAEAGLTLGRTLLQDLLGLPSGSALGA